jgi:hypothetical protein
MAPVKRTPYVQTSTWAQDRRGKTPVKTIMTILRQKRRPQVIVSRNTDKSALLAIWARQDQDIINNGLESDSEEDDEHSEAGGEEAENEVDDDEGRDQASEEGDQEGEEDDKIAQQQTNIELLEAGSSDSEADMDLKIGVLSALRGNALTMEEMERDLVEWEVELGPGIETEMQVRAFWEATRKSKVAGDKGKRNLGTEAIEASSGIKVEEGAGAGGDDGVEKEELDDSSQITPAGSQVTTPRKEKGKEKA